MVIFWRGCSARFPAPVLLPGKSHGRRSLVGCSPWGRLESDTTERLHFHFSLSCIGEGNGSVPSWRRNSSVLAWRIPGTGEPGGLPSMGSHRVGHDWSDLAAAAAAAVWDSGDVLYSDHGAITFIELLFQSCLLLSMCLMFQLNHEISFYRSRIHYLCLGDQPPFHLEDSSRCLTYMFNILKCISF